jgi:hypothetical protein
MPSSKTAKKSLKLGESNRVSLGSPAQSLSDNNVQKMDVEEASNLNETTEKIKVNPNKNDGKENKDKDCILIE